MAKKGVSLQLDKKMIDRLLDVDTLPLLRDSAKEVRDKVQESVGDDIDVDIVEGVTKGGRPYCMVTIMHPKGLLLQSKRGVLSRAATSSGLDLNRYPI